MKRLCPNCKYFGAMETHIVGRRVEIVCPKCGFRVLVIWKPYPSKFRPTDQFKRMETWAESLHPYQ